AGLDGVYLSAHQLVRAGLPDGDLAAIGLSVHALHDAGLHGGHDQQPRAVGGLDRTRRGGRVFRSGRPGALIEVRSPTRMRRLTAIGLGGDAWIRRVGPASEASAGPPSSSWIERQAAIALASQGPRQWDPAMKKVCRRPEAG